MRPLRRLARQRYVVVVLVAALSLLGLHSAFHVWEWLWWPPPSILEALYGHHEVGRGFHAVTEAVVVVALAAGLWTCLRR